MFTLCECCKNNSQNSLSNLYLGCDEFMGMVVNGHMLAPFGLSTTWTFENNLDLGIPSDFIDVYRLESDRNSRSICLDSFLIILICFEVIPK